MTTSMPNRPVVIARGRLVIPAGSGEIAAPGSGATITLYDSSKDWNGIGSQPPGVPFARLVLTLNSSADSAASGIVFSEAMDGTNFDTTATASYTTASGLSTFGFLVQSPGCVVKITYQNSAAVLTVWRFTLTGILGDRATGV